MNVLDLLQPESIKVPLEASDKKGVIEELVEFLCESQSVAHADALKAAVWEREQTRTTGIGQGLAIPHGKSDKCERLLLTIGKPADPIDFDSLDRMPVQLVILLASPPHKTSDHIQALAAISRLMAMEDFRNAVYAAQSADEIYALFKQYETSNANA